MANGFPGYNIERREAFFREDWPIVSASIERLADVLPKAGLPNEVLTRAMIDKLVKAINVMSEIIDDDQAEILSLKTIMKAMERKHAS
jgi:hypothetical protein